MLVVEGLTCRFGTKAAVDNASFSDRARRLRRRDRPLRRRQIDLAAHDQPPGRADFEGRILFDGIDVTALRGRELRNGAPVRP